MNAAAPLADGDLHPPAEFESATARMLAAPHSLAAQRLR